MWYLILFFVTAGAFGAVIGYVVETSWSMTTETLIGAGVTAGIWLVFSQVVRPNLAAIDAAIRDAEESASR